MVPGEALPGSGQGRRSYSKEELQQILQERNELKTSLFLVQEELAYYQRSVYSCLCRGLDWMTPWVPPNSPCL